MSTLAEANRKYFDAIGPVYDDKPWFAKVNQQVTDFLRENLDWVGIPFTNTGSTKDGKEVRMIDYACGPGLLSRVYGPYVTVTRGVDVSPNMVATYNARARTANLPPSTINAVVGNLFDKADPRPRDFEATDWWNFDLATAGFAFHHFEDVVLAAERLKERLRPGGVLVISDFLEGGDLKADENGDPVPGTEGDHAHHNHGYGHGHTQSGHHDHHHDHGKHEDNDDPTKKIRKDMSASIVVPSFTIEGVTEFFEKAGLVDVDVMPMKDRVYMEFAGRKIWRTVIFAKGMRPLAEKSEL